MHSRVYSPAKVEGQGEMILMHLLVFRCLTMLTIEMYLVNLDPSLPLRTGLTVYTKMLGLDFSLGEQQLGRYIPVFIQFLENTLNTSSYLHVICLILSVFDI